MMKNKKKLLLLVPVILVAAVLIYKFYLKPPRDLNIIRVSGNIEVIDVEVSFKIAGRVEKRPVDEGEIIKACQLVAQLDTTELVQEVGQRRAEVREAQANLAKLEAGYRPEEIGQAAADAQRSKADVDKLQADYRRQKELYDKDVISAREFEASKAAYDMARARLRESGEKLALFEKGFRREDIELARAQLQKARELLAQSETRLGYATLLAPMSGVVLSKNVEPGEYVVPGTPIVTVGDLERPWLRAYINETDLGRVKVGQQVRVTTDTYPGKIYEGKLSFISSQAEFTPKNVQTEKERVKLVYRVKVDIANPEMELKPGMPADADILAGATGE